MRAGKCLCDPECLWFDSMKQELMWEQTLDMEVEVAGRRPELRGDQEKKGHQIATRGRLWETAQLSLSRMMKAG